MPSVQEPTLVKLTAAQLKTGLQQWIPKVQRNHQRFLENYVVEGLQKRQQDSLKSKVDNNIKANDIRAALLSLFSEAIDALDDQKKKAQQNKTVAHVLSSNSDVLARVLTLAANDEVSSQQSTKQRVRKGVAKALDQIIRHKSGTATQQMKNDPYHWWLTVHFQPLIQFITTNIDKSKYKVEATNKPIQPVSKKAQMQPSLFADNPYYLLLEAYM